MPPCPRVTFFFPSRRLTRPPVLFTPSFLRSQRLRTGVLIRLKLRKDRIEYNWIKDVETLEEYAPGGYYPIMIGNVLHDRYHIADKLGFGGSSTVWLARDLYLKRYVALKVNIADSIAREAKALKTLSNSLSASLTRYPGRAAVPLLLDEF